MDFTVFYAWQSDRPQKTHRYLIRDAAKEAVKRIGRDATVEDSPRLDHDTKDVPGTPEIAGTIFRKIRESGAFIADLTFIGATDLHDRDKKLLPNPNVLLELGYAARSIGWDRIICVMNTAFGPVEEQIFDIRQRRWPICYRLEDENPRDIQNARESLSGQLQNAIRMVMNGEHEAVEEAISRLTPEVLRVMEAYRDSIYFGIADADVTRVGVRWLADAFARLLDLKLIRAYFEPAPDVNRFVYTWTYTGKLVIKKMEPIFLPIPPSDVKGKPEDPKPDDGVRPSGGPVLTRLRALWTRRR
jgi:hypothetical protein